MTTTTETDHIKPDQFGAYLAVIRSGQIGQADVPALLDANPEFAKWYRVQIDPDEILRTLRNPGPAVRPHSDFLERTAKLIERQAATIRDAEASFEFIRLKLVEHLEEPARSAFWKAVESRNAMASGHAAQAARTWDVALSDRVMQLRDGGAKTLSISAILGLIGFVRDGEGAGAAQAQPGCCRGLAPVAECQCAQQSNDETFLRKLVDVVWNEATESTAVSSTNLADRLIKRAREALSVPSASGPAQAPGEA